MRKVKDFRPATREEIVAHLRRHNGADPGRAAAKPTRRSARTASPPGRTSANGVRHRLRELGSRYFRMPQRALATLRSRTRSRLPKQRRALQRE
jgi:hypothetical protein